MLNTTQSCQLMPRIVFINQIFSGKGFHSLCRLHAYWSIETWKRTNKQYWLQRVELLHHNYGYTKGPLNYVFQFSQLLFMLIYERHLL